ncbi:related to alpha/beta superfamily hydrolase [Rhynchosporium agropyri]|uniref:Related to alpha/beta superfamily hydrolase n=1 Tax=Rhynchosporium agropyri TaxID=914238 RepID=A0A1E1KR65_9HELO|nr:related to alpha/beta superfamily hydrolase [Rhynchosporium agropyri]
MVLLQNKIIYMPGLPPNARREKISDYKNQCSGIEWREESITSLDGTKISLCVARVNKLEVCEGKMVYILYFQGNASSIPPRLPFLSPILHMLGQRSSHPLVRYTMVCCSYRGYWTSKGRPSEKGIAMDAEASLEWIKDDFPRQGGKVDEPVPIVIWGQSIGAGVATNLAAQARLFRPFEIPNSRTTLCLQTMILETPFISTKYMLETLYPQKWLPYRYLWPFLWNHLDSHWSLGQMRKALQDLELKAPSVVILEAGKDELVPKEHGNVLERRCQNLGVNVKKVTVGGALHTEITAKPKGRRAIVEAIENSTRLHGSRDISIQ